MLDEEKRNELSYRLIGCCLAVHRELGPGLHESAYEDSLAAEMSVQKIRFERQYPVPVLYGGKPVGDPLRLDFLIEGCIVLEVKAVDQTHRVHWAQVLTYLKLTRLPLGLLVNFNTASLREGIKRVILTPKTSL